MVTLIRPVEIGDAQAIAVLVAQLGYEATSAQCAARLDDAARDPSRCVLVVEHDARVVAWMELGEVASLESGRWAEIRGLVVDEAMRSTGIGARLVDEAITWARARGMPTLRVRTNELRLRTHAFYERRGFTRSKSQRVYGMVLDARKSGQPS
jgi:N-acetylglutamate synthase-like GNAT family acetyltransferase